MTEDEVLRLVVEVNAARKELFPRDSWQWLAVDLALAAMLEEVGHMKYVPGGNWLYGKERVAAHAALTKGGE